MKIKLSDYILEQSISDASIDDITLEQLKAELRVDIAINEFYIKNYNMGLFQEVTAQQPPPDYSEFRDVESQEALQQRWQDQLRELGVEFKSEEHDSSLSPYIQKIEQSASDQTIIGTYNGSDGNTYIFTVYNDLLDNKNGEPALVETHLFQVRENGKLSRWAGNDIDLSKVNMSDVNRDNLMNYMKHSTEAHIEWHKNNPNYMIGHEVKTEKWENLKSQRDEIADRDIGGKKYRDAERENMKAVDKSYSPDANPNGNVIRNAVHKSLENPAVKILGIIGYIAKLINTMWALKRMMKYGKMSRKIEETMKSINIYLKGIMSTCVNNPTEFNETEFSTMVAEYNRMLNQAVQVARAAVNKVYDDHLTSKELDAELSGHNVVHNAYDNPLLIENDNLIKTIQQNRGIIESRLSKLDEKSAISIVRGTNEYEKVLIPAIEDIQAEFKRIRANAADVKKMDQMVQNQSASAPTQTSAPTQAQPPQQQKKPGELAQGGMMQQQG
jgi:hypothetical protein